MPVPFDLIPRQRQEDIRLRWLSEPSPYAADWLPGSIGTPSTASDLDELLLSLTRQEATHATR